MPENVSPTPPNTQSSSSSLPSGQSPPDVTKPIVTSEATKPTDKETLVKSLVEQGAKKYAPKPNGETKPPVTPEKKPDDKPVDAKAKPVDPKLEKPDDKAVKPEDKPDVDGDPKLAIRIARLATAEDKNRLEGEKLTNERKAFETERTTVKEKVVAFDKFTGEFVTDPVKALRNIGLEDKHLDALYWRLNHEATKALDPTGKPVLTAEDVEKRAREIADERIKNSKEEDTKQSQAQFDTAMAEAHKAYVSAVGKVFDASKDKFPAVAAWGVTASDIRSHIEKTYSDTRKMPSHEETLTHFESEYQKKIEAAGYKKPTVEAPITAKEPIQSSKTLTKDWQAGSSPTGDGEKSTSQTLKESRDEIKRKLDAGFFKRQRA